VGIRFLHLACQEGRFARLPSVSYATIYNARVGNLRHACHTWHAKQFPMVCRSSMFHISILLWFTQKVYSPWLV